MSNLRQAAQQALEAWFRPHGINYVDFKPYMEALRAALAEPERKAKPITADEMSAWVKDTWEKCQAEAWQKPVAWYCNDGLNRGVSLKQEGPEWTPLYTAPTPRRPLTDEALYQIVRYGGYAKMEDFARLIEQAHGIGDSNE